MLVFYASAVSNYCAKVEIVLRAKGLAFEKLSPPGGYGSSTYKAIVPAGTIPALVDGDLVLSESEVINEYLDEALPEPPMLPRDVRARARARVVARFHDTRLEPPLRALFGHMSPAARDPAFVAARVEDYRRRLDDLAGMVAPSPFACGATLSLADAAWPATWLMGQRMLEALAVPLELPAVLARWRERLAAHPAVAPVLEETDAALRAWLVSKGAV